MCHKNINLNKGFPIPYQGKSNVSQNFISTEGNKLIIYKIWYKMIKKRQKKNPAFLS